MSNFLRTTTFAAIVATAPIAAGAQKTVAEGDPAAAAGRAFALQACTPCHVVSSRQLSPPRFATAPDFRAIANTPAMTASALHAFLSSPHPTMPSLILSRQEEKDVIAYILSLRH
jgi:mono/diheme cytochrome c family protein